MGKQFPATWKVDAYYHTPGAEIVGNVVNHNERVITIDDQLIAPVFIANIDEAMNHYDVRSIYSVEAGNALANQMDKNVLQTSVLAARASATVTGASGGSLIHAGTDVLTNANSALVNSFFTAAQTLDEKDVPESGRYGVLRPAQYYKLIQDAKLPDRDLSASPGADFTAGKVREVCGIEIVKSNHLPSTNITTGNSKYQGDFTNTVGLVINRAAVGTVKLLDLATEGEYDIRRQGTLIVAKYLVGHGILRPECAVEIRRSTS